MTVSSDTVQMELLKHYAMRSNNEYDFLVCCVLIYVSFTFLAAKTRRRGIRNAVINIIMWLAVN